MTTKVGVVGYGTVGQAVYSSVSPKFDTVIYDPYKGYDDLTALYDCNYIFMCLPKQRDVMDVGYAIVDGSGREDIVFIVKTTVDIGYTEYLQQICGNAWCFNPEFLTDRTAIQDFRSQHRIVLGGTCGNEVEMVQDLYREIFPHTPVIKVHARTAEMGKLMINLFFMTKISFMNEMRDIADAEGIPWDSLMKVFSTDGRIALSHLDVPGHDGKRGFGGKCFPKNLDDFLDWMEYKDRESHMIKAIKQTNDKYR